MDNVNEIKDNSYLYKYSESGIRIRNLNLWKEINEFISLDITFKEKFYLYENRISNLPKCYCGINLKFIDMKKGYRDFCSKNCMLNSKEIKDKRKNSCMEKYGVDNPSKSQKIKDKVKKTNKDKFGTEYPLQSKNIIDKSKKYFLEKYGVDNPSKIPGVREKANKTTKEIYGVEHAMLNDEIKIKTKKSFVEKYGVDNPSKLPEIREKAINTMIDKYGVSNALKNPFFMEKLKNTNLKKYGTEYYTKTKEYKEKLLDLIFKKNSNIVNNEKFKLLISHVDEFTIYCNICNNDFTIQRQLYRNRTKNNISICLNCNPIDNSISVEEKNILLFIKENYEGEIIENYKDLKKEIDIYLPELKLGFEFNGLYWHSELHKEKLYHYNKYKLFKDNGIVLVSIWEDDWEYRKEIVKSMILHKLEKSNKIFARKCEIKEISDNNVIRDFLINNHIQGFVGSKIKLGLYYNNELVSLMSFGNLRKSLGQKSKNESYELLRFCNKLNTTVIGGASKLFKYFLKEYNPNEVISYSLNNYSTGGLYINLGFNLKGETNSSYFWCKNKNKFHRFNFRKDKLIKDGYDSNLTEKEIMYSRGYFRIFDCGSKKYIFEKNLNP